MRRASTSLVVVIGLVGLVGCRHTPTAAPAPHPSAPAPQTTPPAPPPPSTSAPPSGSTATQAPESSGPAAAPPKPAPSKPSATGGTKAPVAATNSPKPAATPKSGAGTGNSSASPSSGAASPPASSTKPSSSAAAATPSSPSAPASKPSGASAATTAAPTGQTLDLNSLEQRLKDTRAIGVFTKLSLKNQVDDLLDDFRAFHRKQAQKSLNQLRQQYDVLLLKVLSLLQDGDPPLASAIASSREAIWGVLTDPEKFSKI